MQLTLAEGVYNPNNPKKGLLACIAEKYILRNGNPISSIKLYEKIADTYDFEGAMLVIEEMRKCIKEDLKEEDQTQGNIRFGVFVMGVSSIFETIGVIYNKPNLVNSANELKHNVLSYFYGPKQIEPDDENCAYDDKPAPCSYGDWKT